MHNKYIIQLINNNNFLIIHICSNQKFYNIAIDKITGKIICLNKFKNKDSIIEPFWVDHCSYSFAYYNSDENIKLYYINGCKISKVEFFLKKVEKLIKE